MAEETIKTDMDVIGEESEVEESAAPAQEEPPEEEEEEKEEEEEEKEEKEEEEDDEEKEVKILLDRPSVKEIRTKYPDLFKDFPSLREAFFREREFTALFPTVEDAKEAFENNEAYDQLSDSAFQGDPGPLMESLSRSDKRAHDTFAMAFLPDLYKRDQEVYGAVITPLFENLVKTLYKSTDENLKNSAINLAQYLWGEHGESVASGKKTLSSSVQLSKEQAALKASREEQVAQKFQQTYNEVSSELQVQLRALVMKDFDPNQVFSKLVRNQLANETVRRIFKQLESDEAHKAVMGARWKRARSNGYSESDKSKIISTFLARARTLVPATREKVRKAALGKVNGKEADDKSLPVHKTVEHPREARGGKPPGGSRVPAPKVDYRKMSDLDILKME